MMSDRKSLYEVQKHRLDAYLNAKYNFDLTRIQEYTTENGWHVDDYETELPLEMPGPPETHGSWAAAREVLRNYTFPPPDLITGIFLPEQPLEQRVMVLRGRFLFFNFWFGVRIGGVRDELLTLPSGEQEQVWGYNYRTLEGHFERGQIDFTIHKNLTTGGVRFHIHSFSQTGRIRNPFYWLGFKLFGRGLQKKFSRESIKRLKAQVEQMLHHGWQAPNLQDAPTIQSTDSSKNAQDQLNEAR